MNKFEAILGIPDDVIEDVSAIDATRYNYGPHISRVPDIVGHLNQFINNYNQTHRFERNDNCSHAALKYELANFLHQLWTLDYAYNVEDIMDRIVIFADPNDPSQINLTLTDSRAPTVLNLPNGGVFFSECHK